MQKKTIYRMMFMCFVWLILSVNCMAAETTETMSKMEPSMDNPILRQQMELLNWEEIQSLEDELKDSVPYLKDFDFTTQVMRFISGEERFSVTEIMSLIGKMFIQEIGTYLKIMIRFILIVLLCSFLKALSQSFKSKDITKIAFMVCYILIIFTITQSLFVIVALAQTTIDQLNQILQVTLPTLLAFMAVSGYVTSSSALASAIIGGFNVVTFIIQKICLPAIVSIIVLQIISTMSEEIKVDKFVELFYRGMKWLLRGTVIISVAVMGAYKMTLPYVDVALKKGTINLSTAFLPIVGDASKGALEFIMSCSALIKNAFAIGVIIWVIVLAAIPLIKIITYSALYHLASAIIQPIGEKKMTEIASILGKGCEFILSTVGIVVILTLASMLICASIGVSMT